MGVKYQIEPVDAVSLNGRESRLHVESGVQDESVLHVDSAMRRDDALDMTEGENTQHYFNIMMARHALY